MRDLANQASVRPADARRAYRKCCSASASTLTWCGRTRFSRDPDFASKVKDVVGLYVNPPEHAVVLRVDEKTSI
jgi:hypothetical protein